MFVTGGTRLGPTKATACDVQGFWELKCDPVRGQSCSMPAALQPVG